MPTTTAPRPHQERASLRSVGDTLRYLPLDAEETRGNRNTSDNTDATVVDDDASARKPRRFELGRLERRGRLRSI